MTQASGKTILFNLVLGMFLFSLGLGPKLDAESQPLALNEVLGLVEAASPRLSAALEREKEAKADTGETAAYLYPKLDLDGVDSTGFPGSGSPTPAGFGGLVNSPYRSGAAVDAVATWTLFDLSEHYDLNASELEEASARERRRLERLQIDQDALRLYVQASRDLGLEQLWQAVGARIEPILKVVRRFVLSGRYNQVQELLLQDQSEQAALQVAKYQSQHQEALMRLALAMGKTGADFEVPLPENLEDSGPGGIKEGSQSPLLDLAEKELQSAAALSTSASLEGLPKLYVQGSLGTMQDTRLVSESDYSAWVGVSVPIFEGFKIASEQLKAQARFWQKKDEAMQVQLDVDDANARFDAAISLAQEQSSELAPQLLDAEKNFSMAKDRYLNFLGNVNDLEESIRNVSQIQAELLDTEAEFYLAKNSKRIFNGTELATDPDRSSSN